MKSNQVYNYNYFKKLYNDPIFSKLKLNQLYHLWISYFCLIKPARLTYQSKILDVGCGIGNFVYALRKLGYQAYGTEPAIDAKSFSKAPNYCRYGITKKLPYKNNYFDLVFTNEVLEHIDKNKVDLLINEVARVSKLKIIHIICTSQRGKMAYTDPTHINVQTEDWWFNKFINLGYEVIKGNKFYFFPSMNNYMFKTNFIRLKSGYFYLEKNN